MGSKMIASHLHNIYAYLFSLHPAVPWVVLALAAKLANVAADRLGVTAKIEAAYPWGARARKALRELPGVVIAAAWPALTLEQAAARDVVLGAVCALVLPVGREILAWFRNPGPPPSGGAAKLTLVLLAGCSPAPRYSQAEVDCIALAAAETVARIAECGQNTEGPCSTDAIVDAERVAVHACIDRNP